jgi:RnfABCDGE-type electron transport complex B subunit
MNIIVFSVIILGAIGLFFSLVLAYLSSKLRVKQDPRVAKVIDLLPGLNCGACGYSGCAAYAQAVVNKPGAFKKCLAAEDDANKNIARIVGAQGSVAGNKKIAVCHCGADKGQKKASFNYQGLASCRAAALIGGNIDCGYGCLGFGDCADICPVDAIIVKDFKVIVDIDSCIGCGRCVDICPRNLFSLVLQEESFIYNVSCSNKDKGAKVRKVCSRGCIACGLCAKVDNSPYQVKDNLSIIKGGSEAEEKNYQQGMQRCPTKCIDKIK